MSDDVTLNLSSLFGFLLVLARVSGVFALAPLPGMPAVPEVARVALSIAFSIVLLPVWPQVDAKNLTVGRYPALIATQLEIGLLIGVSLSFLFEVLQLAAQVVGLQAGYSYASTIDPNSQADVSVLQLFTQLLGGFLFFALGLDGKLLRLLATGIGSESWDRVPATEILSTFTIHLGSNAFLAALKLALPIVSCLILIDLSLSIVAKLNAQLQMLSLSFPAKMMTGLLLLALTLSAFVRFELEGATRLIQQLVRILRN